MTCAGRPRKAYWVQAAVIVCILGFGVMDSQADSPFPTNEVRNGSDQGCKLQNQGHWSSAGLTTAAALKFYVESDAATELNTYRNVS